MHIDLWAIAGSVICAFLLLFALKQQGLKSHLVTGGHAHCLRYHQNLYVMTFKCHVKADGGSAENNKQELWQLFHFTSHWFWKWTLKWLSAILHSNFTIRPSHIIKACTAQHPLLQRIEPSWCGNPVDMINCLIYFQRLPLLTHPHTQQKGAMHLWRYLALVACRSPFEETLLLFYLIIK